MSMNITQDEIMDAIRAAIGPPPNDEGRTVAEYARAEGITIGAARALVRKAVIQGRLLKGKGYRPQTDGKMYPSTVYRAAPKGKRG